MNKERPIWSPGCPFSDNGNHKPTVTDEFLDERGMCIFFKCTDCNAVGDTFFQDSEMTWYLLHEQEDMENV